MNIIMNWITSFFKIFGSISTELIASMTLMMFVFLFIPEEYGRYFHISEFREKYNLYLGPAAIFFAFLLAARIFHIIKKICFKKIDESRRLHC